jgi:3-hydroxyisobutyrate dehydrogenase-like beta-hydroxyacid dehydrogenase
MSTHDRSVTVVGLGPMGQAMAAVLLDAGHPITVWNRTPSRADGVVARGATLAATPAQAISASELAILSLTDYAAMYDVLADADLTGRVLANLSSDTPERTRAAARWATDRGATLLVGGLMVPAPLLGTDAAYGFYSGPRATFDAHAATLARIARPDYRGEDPGLAQLFYQAQLDVFLTSLSGYLHATALLRSAGVLAKEFAPYATETFTSMPAIASLADAAEAIDAGAHPGDLARVTMMGATADHIVGASREAGIDAALPEAIKAQYDRAIAAGHGESSWTSLIEGVESR